MNIFDLFKSEARKRKVLVSGVVMSEPLRCVQCGICSYYCPINIDVRLHAWKGEPIEDSHCLTCGECIQRCPRGVLWFEESKIFK